jgi:hypothetical protein
MKNILGWHGTARQPYLHFSRYANSEADAMYPNFGSYFIAALASERRHSAEIFLNNFRHTNIDSEREKENLRKLILI